MISPHFEVTGEEAKSFLPALVKINEGQLRKNPQWPSVRSLIKQGKIQYRLADPQEHWQTYRELVEAVQANGIAYADCEDLASAVAAEDRVRRGIQTEAYAYKPKENLFHVVAAVPQSAMQRFGARDELMAGWPAARGASRPGFVLQDPSAAAGMGTNFSGLRGKPVNEQQYGGTGFLSGLASGATGGRSAQQLGQQLGSSFREGLGLGGGFASQLGGRLGQGASAFFNPASEVLAQDDSDIIGELGADADIFGGTMPSTAKRFPPMHIQGTPPAALDTYEDIDIELELAQVPAVSYDFAGPKVIPQARPLIPEGEQFGLLGLALLGAGAAIAHKKGLIGSGGSGIGGGFKGFLGRKGLGGGGVPMAPSGGDSDIDAEIAALEASFGADLVLEADFEADLASYGLAGGSSYGLAHGSSYGMDEEITDEFRVHKAVAHAAPKARFGAVAGGEDQAVAEALAYAGCLAQTEEEFAGVLSRIRNIPQKVAKARLKAAKRRQGRLEKRISKLEGKATSEGRGAVSPAEDAEVEALSMSVDTNMVSADIEVMKPRLAKAATGLAARANEKIRAGKPRAAASFVAKLEKVLAKARQLGVQIGKSPAIRKALRWYRERGASQAAGGAAAPSAKPMPRFPRHPSAGRPRPFPGQVKPPPFSKAPRRPLPGRRPQMHASAPQIAPPMAPSFGAIPATDDDILMELGSF